MRDRTLVVFHYAERASDAPQQLQLRRRNLEYFLRIGVVDDPRVHFILNLAAGNVTEAHPDSCPGSHATFVAKTPSWPLQTPRLLKPAELAPRPRAPGVPTSQELGRGVRYNKGADWREDQLSSLHDTRTTPTSQPLRASPRGLASKILVENSSLCAERESCSLGRAT